MQFSELLHSLSIPPGPFFTLRPQLINTYNLSHTGFETRIKLIEATHNRNCPNIVAILLRSFGLVAENGKFAFAYLLQTGFALGQAVQNRRSSLDMILGSQSISPTIMQRAQLNLQFITGPDIANQIINNLNGLFIFPAFG